MDRSLFFKLFGAFVLVIIVLALVTTVLANQATKGLFRTYTDQNGQVLAEYLAPALADYYAQNSTWDGVAGLLQLPAAGNTTSSMGNNPVIPTPTLLPQNLPFVQPTPEPASPGMGRGGMGHGMMGMGSGTVATPAPGAAPSSGSVDPGSVPTSTWRGGMGPGMRGTQGMSSTTASNMWSMMGNRVIVADTSGKIVSDSSGETNGAVLSAEQLASGQPIQVAGQSAGTVLIGAGETLPGTPAGEFLRAMNQSILVAVFAAGAVALLLGSILFFQITAPVRKLKAAASAIAQGDLSQRVSVKSRDELGDLAVTFNTMAESLGRAEMQRRQMVADVAHELRTPISVIQANLEAMQDGVLPLDADEIASLHEETVLLSRLVSDLHLLSLAEAGQLKLEREEVEPVELIQKAAERLNQNALERGVSIEIEAPASLPAVLADTGRLNQVLGNLIGNALRYTNPGGEIMVKVEESGNNHPVHSQARTSEVLVSVTDTGCGIPAEDLPHIFDRFYRADKSRTRATGGSGLGLAITKHIVEAHGGRVWVESPVWSSAPLESRGTRISFTLPAAANKKVSKEKQ